MLKESEVDFEIIEYLKQAPTINELDNICKGLNLDPLELIRTGDKLFKELELDKKDSRSRDDWLKLISENPGLMERPIVVYNGKYAIGRPPESIKDILN